MPVTAIQQKQNASLKDNQTKEPPAYQPASPDTKNDKNKRADLVKQFKFEALAVEESSFRVDQRVVKPETKQEESGEQGQNRLMRAMKINILQRYMDQV